MTRLAQQHQAINLSQGFPDFDGPAFVKEAATRAIVDEANQYAPMPGLLKLRQVLAGRHTSRTGLACDVDANVVVTAGCTEAIAAALLGLCEADDEVVLIEPFYDSYRACVAMAGAKARYAALRPVMEGGIIKKFVLDEAELRGSFSSRTKAIVINTPHNPTGKVFSRDELAMIAKLCIEHDCVCISDEVYDQLVLEHAGSTGREHVSIATLPGMDQRTLTLGSIGKTFSFTGWKVGWAIGPANLIAACKAAHQFLTFAVATPLQHASAAALEREEEVGRELRGILQGNAEVVVKALGELGFEPFAPEGGYFVIANQRAVAKRLGIEGDQALCMKLIEQCGVACIPPSVFYEHTELGQDLIRVAICKTPQTVAAGIERLRTGLGRGHI
jgi:aspartate/methionine/tyrosine aminotransferase